MKRRLATMPLFKTVHVRVAEDVVLAARNVAFLNLEPWAAFVGNPMVPKRKRELFNSSNSTPRSGRR